jgi:hypothetical protein
VKLGLIIVGELVVVSGRSVVELVAFPKGTE